MKQFIILTLLSLMAISCEDNNDSDIDIEVPKSTENDIKTFEILDYQKGNSVINRTDNTIKIDVIFDSPITKLVAKFTLSQGAIITVNGNIQKSELTTNNFTNPILYTTIAEDGVSKLIWTVTVSLLEEPKFSVSTFVSDFPGNDGISIDLEGNLFVNSNGFVNQWNGTTIYKVTPAGEVSLFQENLPSWPVGSIFDQEYNLYVTGWKSPGIVSRISHDGSVRDEIASGISEPSGLEIDNDGNLYVMEPPFNKMIKISPAGEKSDFVSGGPFNKVSGITFDKVNSIFYTTNWNDGVVGKVTMNREIISFVNLPVRNLGPIIIVDDFLYTTSPMFNKIYRINIHTQAYEIVAGTGARGNKDGYGNEATFTFPLGIAISNDKTKLYISEVAPTGNGNLRTITFND